MSENKKPPPRVGLYDIERTIGRGNFAKVMLARHRSTHTEVRKKVILYLWFCVQNNKNFLNRSVCLCRMCLVIFITRVPVCWTLFGKFLEHLIYHDHEKSSASVYMYRHQRCMLVCGWQKLSYWKWFIKFHWFILYVFFFQHDSS